jgi:urease accessory protein UreH
VAAVVAALFGLGAIMLLREGFSRGRDGAEDAARSGPGPASFTRSALTSFGVLFAAEWGDASQLATAGLTARYGHPLAVGAGAFLEWWPDPLIPFRGARLWQEAACTVHPEGTLLYGDLMLPGRAGAGERHEYAYYRSRVSARRPDGTLLFADTQALAPPPAGARAPRPALPSGLHGIGTAYILSRVDTLAGLLGAVREALCGPAPAAAGGAGRAGAGHVLGGASLLPGDCGLVVRFLAPDGRAGRCAMASIRAAARRWLLGSAPPAPRKL